MLQIKEDKSKRENNYLI